MLRSSLFWASAVPMLLRQRKHFVRQVSRTDCGVAAALTVLNLMGRRADPTVATDVLDPDRKGANREALRQFFETNHGLEASAVEVPKGKLHKLRGRVILHMTQQHYVVLLKQSRHGVLVFDPAMGPVFYPRADFDALFSGAALQVRKKWRQKLPALPTPAPVAGQSAGRGREASALFILGFASRLLEAALILCLVATLYLVLNRASFTSILAVVGLVVLCGVLLLVTRRVRFGGEEDWTRRKQRGVWRDLMRSGLGPVDLAGFRGRRETEVSGQLRRGMTGVLPPRGLLPGALGSVLGMAVLLTFLSIWAPIVYLGLFAALVLLLSIGDVRVCKVSVRKGIGRYTKITPGYGMLNPAAAPDFAAEFAKWAVVGTAGIMVLYGALPPVALMFWILTAMQIVPIDFRKVPQIAPALLSADAMPALTAAQVPLRQQRVVGSFDLKVNAKAGQLAVDGIAPLTASMQQPDLTVREQRLILADVVRHAVEALPEAQRPGLGPLRIFGPGQEASQADFEQLMIARDTGRAQESSDLPVALSTALDAGSGDPVLRDLLSCDPGDLPVFWDVRGQMKLQDLRERLRGSGLQRAGHLTMRRLTLVEAA